MDNLNYTLLSFMRRDIRENKNSLCYLFTDLNSVSLQSDFYMYDIQSGKWTLITEDTHSMGGPKLIFDHQMVIDIQQQTLFIFGGRILTR